MDISFASKLEEMDACDDAVEWVGGRDLSTAWDECERPDWMFWLASRLDGKQGWSDRKQIILVAADIAESVLHLTREHDREVCAKAIRAARDFANGLIDRDAAYAAAHAADAAAYAARAAAYAAADTADAAAHAADAAAYAADAAADAAARAAKRKEICQLIRERITVGNV